MILVLLGTQNNSFYRLLDEIEECIKNKIITEEVIVQAGHTAYSSNNMKILDFISSSELDILLAKSSYVITHGGVGSIISSINKNKKVIAVPRLSKYNEHVNDHQIQIVGNFNKNGYIVGIDDVTSLPTAINKINTFIPKEYKSNTNQIIDIIDNFIKNN